MAQADRAARFEAEISEDAVLPFSVPALHVRGRVIRLGTVVDEILRRHEFPVPVSRLLGEALVLTALLGSSLKFTGRFVLQTRSDGIVDFLVSDYEVPGKLRGYCRYDAEKLARHMDEDLSPGLLMGEGHLAFTVDQGSDMQQYQGIVPLEGESLAEVAQNYFRQSEQIPTRIRLAASEIYMPSLLAGTPAEKVWRAGGIVAQYLPKSGGLGETETYGFVGGQDDYHAADGGANTDSWTEAASFIDTVEDHELLDPMVPPERLLYRLFHERGVRVFDKAAIGVHCRCSRERIGGILKQFDDRERDDMTEDGVIRVKCEFCARTYEFDPSNII